MKSLASLRKNSWATNILVATILLLLFSFSNAEAKTIELNASNHNPENSTIGQAWNDWAKWVNERSGGSINVTVHHAGSLLKGQEEYNGIKRGMADIGLYVIDSKDGFMLSTIAALPFMGFGTQENGAAIYKELLNKFPEMRAEFQGLKIMGMIMTPPSNIHTSKKLVKTPEDLKGMKFLTPTLTGTVLAMGATPVHIDIGDIYMSIDRGLIDGIVLPGVITMVFGILEKLPYHTIFGDSGINTTPMFSIMNESKFNSLPQEAQKILEESIPIWEKYQLEQDYKLQAAAKNAAEKMHHTFVTLSEEEIAVWRDKVKGPVYDKWIEDNEAKGLPGKAVYEETLRLIKMHSM